MGIPPASSYNLKLPPRSVINFSNFPDCAYTSCIKSGQFSPARLGCIGTVLTQDCLCSEAVTPLSCAGVGPSDEDNCWFDLEDWFASACTINATLVEVPTIQTYTMPACIGDCVYSSLALLGCGAPTRNCFCAVSRDRVVESAAACFALNCAPKMAYSFDAEQWRDTICTTGDVHYDQAAYDGYIQKVHDTRIAVPVVMALVCAVLLFAGVVLGIEHDDGWRDGGWKYTAWIAAVVALLLILTIVPVYTAL